MSTFTAHLSKMFRFDQWVRYILPRQEDMFFVTIFTAVVLLGSRLMNMDGDLGRHLTIGRYILDQHAIPTHDIFSHTMYGEYLTPHEWLAQVLFAYSYRLAGLDGVVLLSALIIAVTFTLVFKLSIEKSGLLLAALPMTILAAAAASVHWLARPHIFTLLITVIWIRELEKWRQEKQFSWWSLPLLMLVWVNIHGAFIIGLLIWGIYLVDYLLSGRAVSPPGDKNRINRLSNLFEDRQTRQLLLLGLITFSVTMLNPAGPRVWGTTLGFLQNDYLVSHTVEYQSPNFQITSFWPFLAMICLSILLAGWAHRRISIRGSLLLVSWTAFSLISARNIAIYAVIAAPILASMAGTIFREHEYFDNLCAYDSRLRAINSRLSGHALTIAGVVIIGVLVFNKAAFTLSGAGNEFSESVFPIKAVDWLIEHPQEKPIFNYFPWGGYLLYRNWPEQQVFIDGQTDFYGEQLTREYEKVISMSEGWQAVLAKYGVERVIVPTNSELVLGLSGDERWSLAYEDETASVLDLNY